MAQQTEATQDVKQGQEETPVTRQSVIAAAVDSATKEVEGDGEEDKKEKKETPSVSEKSSSTEKNKEDEDKLLAEQGRELLLALKDPEQAPQIIKFLAERAGYTKAEIKAAAAGDKQESAAIADDIMDIIKSEMGEEFDVISERLGRALKKILPQQIEKSQEDIRREMQQRESETLRVQSAAELSKLTTNFFGEGEELPDNVSSEMSKYMDRVQPSANMTIKELIDDAFHFAIGKLGLTKVDKTKENKTARNRTDAVSRLASDRVSAEANLKRGNSKPMSRQEAIKAAVEAVNKE